MELREERGLAYYVSCNQFQGRETGMFSFYMGTDPAGKENALTELQRTIARIVAEGISEDELASLKRMIAADEAVSDQTMGNQAQAHALNVLHGLGVEQRQRTRDLVAALTCDDISAVLKKYFSEVDPVITVVSPN